MRLAHRIRAVERKTIAVFARWFESGARAANEPLDAAAVAEARRELAELLGVSEEELLPSKLCSRLAVGLTRVIPDRSTLFRQFRFSAVRRDAFY